MPSVLTPKELTLPELRLQAQRITARVTVSKIASGYMAIIGTARVSASTSHKLLEAIQDQVDVKAALRAKRGR